MTINLNQPIASLNGTPLPGDDGPLTIGGAVLNLLGRYRAASGKEAMEVCELGSRMVVADGDFEADKKDMETIHKAIEQNGVGYVAVVIGRLCKILAE